MSKVVSARSIFNKMNAINHTRALSGQPPILDLTLGQPHLPVNPALIEGLHRFLMSPDCSLQFTYSDAAGRMETRQAIADLMNFYHPTLTCVY